MGMVTISGGGRSERIGLGVRRSGVPKVNAVCGLAGSQLAVGTKGGRTGAAVMLSPGGTVEKRIVRVDYAPL